MECFGEKCEATFGALNLRVEGLNKKANTTKNRKARKLQLD